MKSRRKAESPERMGRREFLRTVAGAAGALALSGTACTRSYFMRPPESVLELGNAFDDISAEALGFIRGGTTAEEAVRAMDRRGLTNIARNSNVPQHGMSIEAITADFQHCIHLFRDRKYEQSVRLEIGAAELPQRYLLRVADYGDGKMIVALIRDSAGGSGPRLALTPYSDGQVGTPSYHGLSELERRHGGMQYPVFVGYDLQFGITFIARDEQGVPWENGYVISWDGRRLAMRPVPFYDLMQCDCIRTWAEER